MAGTELDTELIRPDWPAPPRVCAVATTRVGGLSNGPWQSLNLGEHVGDQARAVAGNRKLLAAGLELPAAPLWLEQVHSAQVADAVDWRAGSRADGCFARRAGEVCVVMTADCLPVLVCDRAGRAVAALHAGWRGLAAGILDAGIAAFAEAGFAVNDLLAWFGPAIGADAYEVGDEVRQAFERGDEREAFVANARGRWQMDLAALARTRLARLGVTAVYGGEYCTYSDTGRFFSHRRDGICGRQAALIWLRPGDRGHPRAR